MFGAEDCFCTDGRLCAAAPLPCGREAAGRLPELLPDGRRVPADDERVPEEAGRVPEDDERVPDEVRGRGCEPARLF